MAGRNTLPVQGITAGLVARGAQRGAPLEEHAEHVELDPALALAVLRLANSPYYGVARRVASVRQALVLLGRRSVGSVVAARAATLVLEEPSPPAPEGYLLHALTTAIASRLVAERVGRPGDAAYTLGLVHDVGTMVLHQRDAALLAQVRSSDADDLLEAESDAFGESHAEAGASLLSSSNLPEDVVTAVRQHHSPIDVQGITAGRVLQCGQALADAANVPSPARQAALGAALLSMGIAADRDQLLGEVVKQRDLALAKLTDPTPQRGR